MAQFLSQENQPNEGSPEEQAPQEEPKGEEQGNNQVDERQKVPMFNSNNTNNAPNNGHNNNSNFGGDDSNEIELVDCNLADQSDLAHFDDLNIIISEYIF